MAKFIDLLDEKKLIDENKTKPMVCKKNFASARKASGGYITISQAVSQCGCSPDVLDLRARGGKLKVIKKNGKIITTPEWLDQYKKQTKNWEELTQNPKEDLDKQACDEIAKELI